MTQQSEDFPSRSADGLAALDIFYAEFNEINFYVEDIDQENLYEVILRNLFPAVRIDRIFPLGGKQAVLAHALSVENDGITAFRAYILDKDFDDLLGIRVSHSNIFYLDRFCIENYMLEESAIVEVVTESHPKKRRKDIARDLGISQMVEHVLSSLKPLFVCFACAQLQSWLGELWGGPREVLPQPPRSIATKKDCGRLTKMHSELTKACWSRHVKSKG